MTSDVQLRAEPLPPTTSVGEEVAELLIRGLPEVPEHTVKKLDRAYLMCVRALPRVYGRMRKVALGLEGAEDIDFETLIKYVDIFDSRIGKRARGAAKVAGNSLAKTVEPGKLAAGADAIPTGLVMRALEKSAKAGTDADRAIEQSNAPGRKRKIETAPASPLGAVEGDDEYGYENAEQ